VRCRNVSLPVANKQRRAKTRSSHRCHGGPARCLRVVCRPRGDTGQRNDAAVGGICAGKRTLPGPAQPGAAPHCPCRRSSSDPPAVRRHRARRAGDDASFRSAALINSSGNDSVGVVRQAQKDHLDLCWSGGRSPGFRRPAGVLGSSDGLRVGHHRVRSHQDGATDSAGSRCPLPTLPT
jgi:hypothetical protein